MTSMAKLREFYICKNCNAQCAQWHGQCPKCHSWNSLELVQNASQAKSVLARENRPTIVPITHVEPLSASGINTGCVELDRILGHGLMPGAAILIAGEPGIGKSTLLMQLAGSVAQTGRKVLYATGEENLQQIKQRADRLNALSTDLLVLSTPRVEDIYPAFAFGEDLPALLIADSVQTLTSDEAEGLPGNVTQVKAVATELISRCKGSNTTLILVGHVTKDGSVAGPRILEHLVDTVISLEGDRKENFRILRILKNRFGPTQELLLFRMEQNGLNIVEDSSTFFLGSHDQTLSGTSLVMTVDGQRPFAVEIQALVTKSWLSVPRRTALGFDINRLYLLLAVLEKRLRLNFSQVDIFAKICGGMKLQEPGLDLPLIAAILSSYYDQPLPERCILWGEVDLNGQIRPVTAHDIRLNQAKRLGYSPILCQHEKQSGKIITLQDIRAFLFQKKNSG